MKMRAIVLPAVAVLGLGVSLPAAAESLVPLQAGTFELGHHVASVFYTDRAGRFEVVTTVAPRADLGGTPAQTVGHLSLGQKQLVSIGAFSTTAKPDTLELVHAGDHLEANVLPSTMALR